MLVTDSVPYPRHYTFDDLKNLPNTESRGVLCANYVVSADGRIFRWFNPQQPDRCALKSLFFNAEAELLAYGYRLETKYNSILEGVVRAAY